MINYYKHSEIDKEKWNRCITKSLSATIFADYDFLTISNPHWAALIKDDYDVVMPLPNRSKLGIHYIYTPYFFSRLGIFSKEIISKEKIDAFIDAIPRKFWQVDLNLNEWDQSTSIDKKAIQLVSYQLDMQQPYLALYGKFSENLKRNIRSAQKYALSIDKEVQVKDIINLFRHNRGKEKKIKIKTTDYNLFMAMVAHLTSRGNIDVWGVRDENHQLLAGACFLKDHSRTWFWFSGRDERYSEKKAMFFLLNEYLKENSSQQIIFDFNGSMNENIARFYSQFGSVKYTYPMLCFSQRTYLNRLIHFYKLIKN